MVIDFHTHIFDEQIAKRAMDVLSAKVDIIPFHFCTKAELLYSMKEAEIDCSVVLPVVTKPSQTKTINDWAASICSDKLIAFGGIHPLSEDYKADIDYVCSLGLKGIKFHPDYQSFFVDDDFMFPIYDTILSKGLIISFHAGVDLGLDPPVHCPPHRLRKVLDQMQGGVIIAAHLGGHAMWDEVEKHLCGTNVYLDTSMGTEYYKTEQFIRIVRSHGSEKILFATDSPWSSQKEELTRTRQTGLTQAELDNILYKNALKLLERN